MLILSATFIMWAPLLETHIRIMFIQLYEYSLLYVLFFSFCIVYFSAVAASREEWNQLCRKYVESNIKWGKYFLSSFLFMFLCMQRNPE